MKRPLFTLAFALFLPALTQAQSHLLRYPTYSKGRVAFSYLGDIWIAKDDGSNVQRLTDHKAREIYPRFSPDGNWLAFSSDREGNYDVYVIPVTGGKPRQLTYHSANDIVVGWRPDGKEIIFSSGRNQGVFPGIATLWEISPQGGMEQPIATDWGSWASYSPDGSKLAFTRHPGVWSRKHYRGSYAVDLWVEDIASKQFTHLDDPDYKGNYLWPMFGKTGDIYYVADELPNEKTAKWGGADVMKSVNNIWKIPAGGGKPVQVTHHTGGNLFFPSMSADGKTIVYEQNFGLWKLDLANSKSSEIKIAIASDVKESDTEIRSMTNAESFNVSPSGKRIALVTHGEVFTIAADRGEPQRVTETPAREQDARWSPNGKWIAFISDRSGQQEIWLSDEMGRTVKKLTDVDCDKSPPIWSPDSKSLLWAGSDPKHKLRHVDIDDGKTEELASCDAGPINSPQFSPDGKWISYSKDDALLRPHVYIKALAGTNLDEHMIDSDEFLSASSAKWTPDGKKLLFVAGFSAPAMSSLNRSTMQLYSVALTPMEKNLDDEKDINTEAQAESAPETTPARRRSFTNNPPANADSDASDSSTETNRRPRNFAGSRSNAAVEVKIEWDNMARRFKRLTTMSGSVFTVVPAPDSRSYAFTASSGEGEGGPGLYTIAEDGSRLTRVGAAPAPSGDEQPRRRGFGGGGGFGDVQWSKDSRTIYYLQGGEIYSVSAPSGGSDDSAPAASPGSGRFGGRGLRAAAAASSTPADSGSTARRISFSVKMEINQADERRENFQEAWNTMKNRFYDREMHGVDWAAAKATYQPLLTDIADQEELHNVIMEMIGELNASHTGISGGGSDSGGERVATRYPGFEMQPDNSGKFKVTYIYKKGPADRDYVKLSVGDYILAVNGRELSSGQNYWRMFNLVQGRKFDFSVNKKPDMDGAWHVIIDPISANTQGNLEYDRWVESRNDMVRQLSKGQVGYLHIKAMDAPSYEKFQRDLLMNLDKKALIIDERFNGGGGIDQELLIILNQRKKYESYRGRDSVEINRPVQAFFGPMAVLENERSASNAEMFPEGFRALGLGKVIGVQTYGAVIGTGAFRLLDGSTLRTPGIGVYTATGQDFENYGVPPDIDVDNTPADFLSGHDRQIEKAVEVLMSEVK